MKAMVLAAGFGTRLQPLTRIIPKPMFPVLGRPLLSHIFDLLLSANISEVAVNIHHLPDFIIDYFEKEKPAGLNLQILMILLSMFITFLTLSSITLTRHPTQI